MQRKKYFQQGAVGYDRRIVFNFIHLGMAGRAGAHSVVGRVFRVAAGIAGGNRSDAFEVCKNRLSAPETPAAEHGNFIFLAHGFWEQTLSKVNLRNGAYFWGSFFLPQTRDRDARRTWRR